MPGVSDNWAGYPCSLQKMLAMPTENCLSSGSCFSISWVTRWQPRDLAGKRIVVCAQDMIDVRLYGCGDVSNESFGDLQNNH